MVVTNRRISDEELVELARAGRREAFDHLVMRYEDQTYRLARRLTRNEEDAEDVLQEAFIQAYRSLSTFKGTSKFSTWLYRITVNYALMRLRKGNVSFVSLDEPLETGRGAIKPDLPSEEPDPLARLIQRETGDLVDRAIDELPPVSRAVFVLRHVEGLSTQDTCKMLNLTPSAAKSRLHRSRTVLAERLTSALEDDVRALRTGAR